MKPAPIALFVYNRPWHTRKTIEALQQNNLASLSALIIFSDGAKSDDDAAQVADVRSYLHDISGFASVTVIESEKNQGLSTAIINGVSKILETYEAVIVLEDDLVTSPFFLNFMNEALTKYRDNDRVVCVNAYMYPVEKSMLPETFFIKGADCQGWATWRRGWEVFEPDGRKLFHELKQRNLIREFDYDNTYSYSRILYFQQKGLVNSWAIRWYAAAFLQNKLTLYPHTSLIENIGFDNSGSNSSKWDKKRYWTPASNVEVAVHDIPVEESRTAKQTLTDYFRKSKKPLFIKIKDKLMSMIR